MGHTAKAAAQYSVSRVVEEPCGVAQHFNPRHLSHSVTDRAGRTMTEVHTNQRSLQPLLELLREDRAGTHQTLFLWE